MPDATVSLIERTIQEADSFCPCNHVPHRGNVCCGQGVCILASCKYPGHAAIRNLARTVLEAAATRLEETADCMTSQDSRRSRSDLRGVAIVIRALMPEEVKQT